MKEILIQLFEHKALTKNQAREVLTDIADSKYNSSQIAAFLSVYLMRSITVDELEGFRDALLDLCKKVDLGGYDCIDLCGTGGDGKNTFNISTLSSFVVAGAGIKVAKHGNYGVSSFCGSSNIMEYFGFEFTNNESLLRKQIDEAGICFLHAPLFHPAMKVVAPVRKELGVKTFFNMLGPLVNPASPKFQINGVFNLELARRYNYLLQQTEKQFVIIYSLDGYDEISLTSPFKMISRNKEQIFDPVSFGFAKINQCDLSAGETLKESADIFTNVLTLKATKAQNDTVVINSAAAIQCARPDASFEECLSVADESIRSGKAFKSFEKLLNIK